MINEIITEMCTLIAQQTEAPIFLSNQGEGFARPSFFISLINPATQDLNKFTINNNIYIQIVYFAPWDDYHNVDATNQYQTWDILKNIFKVGYFMVDGRAVKVPQMSGGPRDAEIYLTLNLTLTENKQPPQPVLPIMENLNFNLKGGIDKI